MDKSNAAGGNNSLSLYTDSNLDELMLENMLNNLESENSFEDVAELSNFFWTEKDIGDKELNSTTLLNEVAFSGTPRGSTAISSQNDVVSVATCSSAVNIANFAGSDDSENVQIGLCQNPANLRACKVHDSAKEKASEFHLASFGKQSPVKKKFLRKMKFCDGEIEAKHENTDRCKNKDVSERLLESKRIKGKFYIPNDVKQNWVKQIETEGHVICPIKTCSKKYFSVIDMMLHIRDCAEKNCMMFCFCCDILMKSDYNAALRTKHSKEEIDCQQRSFFVEMKRSPVSTAIDDVSKCIPAKVAGEVVHRHNNPRKDKILGVSGTSKSSEGKFGKKRNTVALSRSLQRNEVSEIQSDISIIDKHCSSFVDKNRTSVLTAIDDVANCNPKVAGKVVHCSNNSRKDEILEVGASSKSSEDKFGGKLNSIVLNNSLQRNELSELQPDLSGAIEVGESIVKDFVELKHCLPINKETEEYDGQEEVNTGRLCQNETYSQNSFTADGSYVNSVPGQKQNLGEKYAVVDVSSNNIPQIYRESIRADDEGENNSNTDVLGSLLLSEQHLDEILYAPRTHQIDKLVHELNAALTSFEEMEVKDEKSNEALYWLLELQRFLNALNAPEDAITDFVPKVNDDLKVEASTSNEISEVDGGCCT